MIIVSKNPTRLMNCIFCKENSDNSRSIEHIIPESLGNKSHVLGNGIVCDKCNNYFALKVEKEALDLPYFKSLRHRNYILNKKDRRPREDGYIIHPRGGKIEIIERVGNKLGVEIQNREILNLLKTKEANQLMIPIYALPPIDNSFVSRMIGKIALEALAERVQEVENWNNDFIEHKDLDDLRNYVRYGQGKFWPYYIRKVYEEIDTFKGNEWDSDENRFQLLHEYDLLYIDGKYLYFVCIIMGVEYTINIGERILDQYVEWLQVNENKSPLSDEMQARKKL